jgi:hypothetical protein
MGSDGSKRIYTFYDLQIDEVIKGTASGKSLLMRELGGQKDGLGMQVAGTSQFTPGEDVVVFLGEKNPDGSYDVFGMMMGKYNIVKDDDGNEVLKGPGIPSNRGHDGIIHPDDPEGQDGTLPDAKWTLEHLRKLVHAQASLVKEPSNIKSLKPSPSPRVTPEQAPLAAPQLQPSPAVGDANPPAKNLSFALLIGVALIGAVGVFAFLRKR